MAVTDVWTDWDTDPVGNTPDGSSTPEIDDELRNVKAVVKGAAVDMTSAQTIAGVKTFSSLPLLPAVPPTEVNHVIRAGSWQTQSAITGAAGGTGDALTLSLAPVLASYAAGQFFTVILTADNTGAATIELEALGAVDIKKRDTDGTLTALEAGDLKTGQIVLFLYDGTQCILVNTVPPVIPSYPSVVVQQVNTQVVTSTTGTTAIPNDDSIPQITEGDEYMTLAITPTSATNMLRIDVIIHLSSTVGNLAAALFQDAAAGALAAGANHMGATSVAPIVFTHYMVAGTTSETTFRVNGGGSSGTTTFNGISAGRLFGGVLASSITITEILVT